MSSHMEVCVSRDGEDPTCPLSDQSGQERLTEAVMVWTQADDS